MTFTSLAMFIPLCSIFVVKEPMPPGLNSSMMATVHTNLLFCSNGVESKRDTFSIFKP